MIVGQSVNNFLYTVSASIVNEINADLIKMLIEPAMTEKFNERVSKFLH